MNIVSQQIITLAKEVCLLILDVDGVLTDGKIYLSSDGIETLVFHVHDGVGIKLLQSIGVRFAVISGRGNQAVQNRLNALGISHCCFKQENKLAAYQKIQTELKIPSTQAAYIGDDLPDIPVMKQVLFPIAVANASAKVKEAARWETKKNGGDGAVREVCDLIYSAKA